MLQVQSPFLLKQVQCRGCGKTLKIEGNKKWSIKTKHSILGIYVKIRLVTTRYMVYNGFRDRKVSTALHVWKEIKITS